MKLKGYAYTCGDNIDTDVIIPARYLNTHEEKEMGLRCFNDYDENYKETTEQNKIIFSGYNFGCGSSREHAPIALKASGVQCVIGKTFARIFYRNAINIGLPVLEMDFNDDDFAAGDDIIIDFESNTMTNITKNKSIDIPEIPEFMRGILSKGGLMKYIGGAENE